MAVDKDAFSKVVGKLQEEFSIILATLKEKGQERFGRTLVVGIMAVIVSYYFLYLPPNKKLLLLNRKIQTAKNVAAWSDQYEGLRDNLNILYDQLPPVSARERWLEMTVLDTMKAENIMSDSLVPPSEAEEGGFYVQKINVQIQLKFSEIVSWVNRLEINKPLLHIGELDFAKKDEPIGLNNVNIEIGTVIPKTKPGQQ